MNSTPEDNEEPARPDGKSFTVVYHPRSNVKGYRDFTDLNLANAFLKERIAAGDVKARLVSGEAKTTRPAPRPRPGPSGCARRCRKKIAGGTEGKQAASQRRDFPQTKLTHQPRAD